MRIIDDTVGQTFDMLLEDFDNDGRIDFLLTSFDDRIGVKSGSVYIYEIPDDVLYEILYSFNLYVPFFRVSLCIFFLNSNGAWVRHVIADSFVPEGSNTMSPGTPQSFYPSAAYANEILPDGR
jgi:hypothetical protein